MSMALDNLKAELAGLTEGERAELAYFLLDTLDECSADADADVEAAWEAELTRRGDEIHRGTAVGKPAEQVFAELRQRHS
jgi:putative addiction module component (TIGR02574 family)